MNNLNCFYCLREISRGDVSFIDEELDTYYCANCTRTCSGCDEINPRNNFCERHGICMECCGTCDNIVGLYDERRYSDSKKYISKKSGRYAKINRTFGVELEVFNDGNSDCIAHLDKMKPEHFGIVRDGSIGGNNAIEIQSAILSGVKGENAIIDICESLNKLKFKVNDTCGMHLHLSCEDFINEEVVGYISGEEMLIDRVPIMEKVNSIFEVSINFETEELENYVKKSGYCFSKSNNGIIFLEYKESLEISEMKKLTEGARDIKVQYTYYNNSLNKLKKLLSVYTVLDDVFFAMLPHSRKNNRYCKKLSYAFSPREINNIDSIEDMEKMWYREFDKSLIKQKKENRSDNSRYFGFNMHPMFGGRKTLEIRYHSGTTDPKKILNWVKIHQSLFDCVEYLGLSEINRVGLLHDLESKVNYLLRWIDADVELSNYIIGRINKFSGTSIKKKSKIINNSDSIERQELLSAISSLTNY